jgi:hypothetical protein
VLKIGYDERWAAHSPGIQLMWEVLRHAFERRLASVELLGTAEPWLSIWTTRARAFQTLGFYPWSLRGLLGFAGDAATALGRKFAARARR